MGRRLAVAGAFALLVMSTAPSRAEVSVSGKRTVAPGLSTFLVKLPHPNVLYFTQIDPGSEVRVKLAHTKWPADKTAPTSYLCGRCLVAVNGSFFNIKTGSPVGGHWPSALTALADPKRRSSVHSVSWLRKDGNTWPFAKDSFTLGRHPRTFMFGDKTGTMWFAAVDGRQPGHSVGLTLPEVVDVAKRFGATWVINLDGGCSTTFVVKGAVKNRPCQDSTTVKGERPVANAFVVLPRN